jgi:hypothetical protein
MAGTKEGARKGALTNKQKYGPDFYKKIGSQSWKNPERSHETGFALRPKEVRVELGRLGGKKTKNEYKPKEVEYLTAEEIAAIAEIDQDGTGVSE